MKKIILLFTLFCCIIQQNSLKAQTCNEQDSIQLVTFYNQCGGASWSTVWDLSLPVSTWDGIALHTTGANIGRVQSIEASYKLTGALPNFNLPWLFTLNISWNKDLEGIIPNFNLPNLEDLTISYNEKITGNIPSFKLPNLLKLELIQDVGLTGTIPDFDLPQLSYLEISGNAGLTGGIPSFVLPNNTSSLPNLGNLYINGSNLTGSIPSFNLPNNMSSLPNLGELFISGSSSLTGSIPSFNLPKLSHLYIARNDKLTGSIPLFNSTAMGLLEIKYNKSLTGNIPSFNLPSIYQIDITDNPGLTGNIPSFNLPNLVGLTINENLGLTGNIPNFNLPNLFILVIRSNPGLTGGIPAFNLPNLFTLDILENNGLTGSIGTFNLPNLKELAIDNNKNLTGVIPTFDLPNLSELSISGSTKLTGGIPNFNTPNLMLLIITGDTSLTGNIFLSGFPKLTDLYIYGNLNLTGNIPFFNFPKLERLTLQYNRNLTGNIPTFNLPNLTYFSLAGSPKLTGGIPNFNFPKLEFLEISDNANLTGNIPSFNLPKLKSLSINSNTNLTGSIPNFNLPSLESLGIYGNTNLTGGIPNFNLPNLVKLDISRSTNLTGGIPNFNLPNLSELAIIGNTKLSGIIPNFNLPNLTRLLIHENTNLTGNIPNFNLPKLNTLSLYANVNLTGSIPLFNLPKLTDFYISYNPKITGTIPLFNMPNLFSLYIEGNSSLTGSIPNFNYLNLYSLVIDKNINLTGNIPNFDLPSLYQLYISNNEKISGSIPNFNLPALHSLYLEDNNLSGNIPNIGFKDSIYNFSVQGNKFTFGNILSGFTALNNAYNSNKSKDDSGYAPQDTLLPLIFSNGKFTVSLAGANLKDLTYTWYKDTVQVGSPIIGNNTFTPAISGTYSCRVTHANITKPNVKFRNLILNSETKSVIACTSGLAVSSPAINANISPATVAFTVSNVSANTSFVYQWYNGAIPLTPVSGTASNNPVFNFSTNGTYDSIKLVISMGVGCTEIINRPLNIPCNLTVNAGSDKTTCIGSSTVLNAATLGGASTITYAWKILGSAVIIDTTQSIKINATIGSIVKYEIKVQDGIGCVAKDTVIINTLIPSKIDTSFIKGSYNTCASTPINATLTCNAIGSNLQYQWYITTNNSTPVILIPNATQSVLSNVTQPGVYRCKVTGFCNSVDSEPLTLSSSPIAVIVGACVNKPMEIIASGTPTSYQWYKKGNINVNNTNVNCAAGGSPQSITGATLSIFTPPTAGGYFADVFYNGCFTKTAIKCAAICPYAPDGTTPKSKQEILAEAYLSIDWSTYNTNSNTTTATLELEDNTDIGLSVTPNPITENSIIAFSIPKSGQVKINLSDISGKNRFTLINEYFVAGEHQTTLERATTELSKGMYFVTIQFEDKVKTQKIVVVE